MAVVKQCPRCQATAGAIHAKPHCPSKTCNWNLCLGCEATYDRVSGLFFVPIPNT